MLRYILIRFLWTLITLFIILSILYFGLSLVMLHNFGPRPRISFPNNFILVWDDYLLYVKNVFTEFDWGMSTRTESAWDIFKRKAPITIRINLAVLGVYVVVGISLGFIQAIKKDTIIDNGIGIFTMVFGSIPAFVLIFPLVLILGYQLEVLPHRYLGSETDAFKDQLLSLIIPVIALSGPAIARLARFVRGEIVESLDADYILLAKTKGLTRKQAIFRHSVRNSLVPILPEIPALFIAVLMNSIYIESIYRITGLANWYLRSMYQGYMGGGYFYIHTPNAMIVSMFYVGIIVFSTFFIDILFAVVDPRIKMGSKK